MAKYGMLIDLHRCVGCAECLIACKSENNVDAGIFWSSAIRNMSGTFPNVTYEFIPTLCNHCEAAPCTMICPTGAMFKDENGLTMHNPELCDGCRSCQEVCPYGNISYNENAVQEFWSREQAAIPEGTGTGKELQELTGETIPYYNPDREATYDGIRRPGVVEKCTLCDHRLRAGLEPYCVEICPAKARVFGDLDDENSEISRLLKENEAEVLKEEAQTKPKIFYIGR